MTQNWAFSNSNHSNHLFAQDSMDRQFELGFAWKVCLCQSHFGKTAGMVGKTKTLLLSLFLMLGHMPVAIQENNSGSTVSPEALAWNSYISISATFYWTRHAKPRDLSSIKKWGNRLHTAWVEESQCICLCFQPTINLYNETGSFKSELENMSKVQVFYLWVSSCWGIWHLIFFYFGHFLLIYN